MKKVVEEAGDVLLSLVLLVYSSSSDEQGLRAAMDVVSLVIFFCVFRPVAGVVAPLVSEYATRIEAGQILQRVILVNILYTICDFSTQTIIIIIISANTIASSEHDDTHSPHFLSNTVFNATDAAATAATAKVDLNIKEALL